jgi:hypothetical protein
MYQVVFSVEVEHHMGEHGKKLELPKVVHVSQAATPVLNICRVPHRKFGIVEILGQLQMMECTSVMLQALYNIRPGGNKRSL